MLGLFKSFSSNIHYKYSVQSQPTFTAAPWNVFDAKNKATGELASVFVCDKKAIQDLLTQNGLKAKSGLVNEVWDFATRGVQQLTKLRHPMVLKVMEPLEPHKNSLVFVSERVSGTLESLRESEQHDLAIVRGLDNVVSALKFLHNQLGMVHNNLRPGVVFIDMQGDWKVAGFEFLATFADFEPGQFFLPQLDPRMPGYMQPAYDFLAPELVLEKTCLPASDTWSLGCLIYAIYTQKPPLQTRHNPSEYKDEMTRFLSRVQTEIKLPKTLKPYIQSLFSPSPGGRISLEALETTDFFQNPLVKALKSLDEYTAKPVDEKAQFLTHFATLLPQFPKPIRIRKILQFAVQELNGPRDLATGTQLSNVMFIVCQDMSKLSFQEQVLPLFSKLSDYICFQDSVSQNLGSIVNTTSDKDFCKSVVPLIALTLKEQDAQHAPIQSRMLSQTSVFMKNLVPAKVEETLFPAIVDCFASTANKQVKISATKSLSLLAALTSKTLIMDRLIPALQAMKTRDPDIVLAVGELWCAVASKLNNEQIFTLVVPSMLTLTLAKQLTVPQFKKLVNMVRDLISKVEQSQVKELNSGSQEEVYTVNSDFSNSASTLAKPSTLALTPGPVSTTSSITSSTTATTAAPAASKPANTMNFSFPPSVTSKPSTPANTSSEWTDFADFTGPTKPSFGMTANSKQGSFTMAPTNPKPAFNSVPAPLLPSPKPPVTPMSLLTPTPKSPSGNTTFSSMYSTPMSPMAPMAPMTQTGLGVLTPSAKTTAASTSSKTMTSPNNTSLI